MTSGTPARRRGRPPKLRPPQFPPQPQFPPPAVQVDVEQILARTEEQTFHADAMFHVEPQLPIPPDWVKGQLLNVRNAGHCYRVTLLGEEYDPRNPERCLEFPNPYECQQFVSAWYARESYDGRAW